MRRKIIGETVLELGETELKIIGEYVKKHLPQWFYEADIIPGYLYTHYLLVERIVRLEESIKYQMYKLEKKIQQIDEKIELEDLRYEARQKQLIK